MRRRKISYSITNFDYWWQNNKMVLYENVDKSKSHQSHRDFHTAKIAWKVFCNCPPESILIRFIRIKGKNYAQEWIK